MTPVAPPSQPTGGARARGTVGAGGRAGEPPTGGWIGAELVVEPSVLVAGGEALARAEDGRVVFVAGGLPHEQVRVVVEEERRQWLRGRVVKVLRPSSHRVEPPCRWVAAGCGGCDLQHARSSAQPELKRAMVVDALDRLGGGWVTDDGRPPVTIGPALPTDGFRTTVRAAVHGGRAGFRRRRSHEVVVPDHCLVAHPLIDELLVGGRFGSATEVTLRVGAGATGPERLALVAPHVDGVELPDDVVVVGSEDADGLARAHIHDQVAGRRWRISARSFFQTRSDGAEALVAAARRAAGPELAGARLADLYCGVGLFAGALLAGTVPGSDPALRPASAVAVERAGSSVADAAHNLADLPVEVIRSDVDRWAATPADVVVADPSRAGLGRKGAAVVAATGAATAVLISCDVASLGRDSQLLATHGFRLDGSELIDLFPQTHHVEVVSRFTR